MYKKARINGTRTRNITIETTLTAMSTRGLARLHLEILEILEIRLRRKDGGGMIIFSQERIS